jgi:hypothetical protein
LWEDENEASKNVHHKDQPFENLLNLVDNAPLGESEFVQGCSKSITTQGTGSINIGI